MLRTWKASAHGKGGGVRVEVTMRDHRVLLDEPKAAGGTDAGPTPMELLLGALGGCLSIVIAALARREGIALKDVRVEVEGEMDLDGFYGRAPVRTGFQAIRYRVAVDAEAPPERVEALVREAERLCPVKDTLRGVDVMRTDGTEKEAVRGAASALGAEPALGERAPSP